ncbi:hypothetical protein RRG08_048661 [Elysia crispata]|uniref:Helicase ATP-binding domain-containing protein n=1 Tax=Elysia crispata TaxID=231223 RepID=A0AAE1ADB9_9GAST|nr:hypothetical protein RRG08_048661 [Elysia crispata]
MDEFDFDGDDEDDLMAATMSIDMDNKFNPITLGAINSCGRDKQFEKEKQVDLPKEFPFPFQPYDIQTDFMRNLYTCLELGKIGVFESPTGTGKSLSLICGALQWLRDLQEKQRQELQLLLQPNCKEDASAKADTELDWIQEFAAKKEQEQKMEKVKLEQEHIEKREAKLKELQNSSAVRKRKHKSHLESDFDSLISGASDDIKKACLKELSSLEKELETVCTDDHDEDLVVADYNSDAEEAGDGKEDEDNEEEHITKIYYCSRTHSQLSQFVREIMKSPFYEDVRVVSLGSRQNMCINPAVKKLKSLSLMNDRCLDLHKKKSKKNPGCIFRKEELLQAFKDKALLEVADIEQLVTSGRQMKACPYYGARRAVPLAEVVALPYNTLLHKKTREACNIKLEGSVVIVDEAHNLLETINNVHSVEITGAQIIKAHSQLSQYEHKFRPRLKAKNLLYVRQILFVLGKLSALVGGKVDFTADSQVNTRTEVCLVTINDFLFQGQLDNFNMFKLLRYCQRSQISRKLHGFVEKYPESEVKMVKRNESPPVSGLTKFLHEISSSKEKTINNETMPDVSQQTSQPTLSSPLMQIESFLDALTNADKNGRIVICKQTKVGQSSLKFLMLNPAVHFVSILQEARSVIVAGGTMQPVAEFKDQLFHAAGIPPSRILEFSCGHVIPGRQLLPVALAQGPTGTTLDFTFQSREKPLVSLLVKALLGFFGGTVSSPSLSLIAVGPGISMLGSLATISC